MKNVRTVHIDGLHRAFVRDIFTMQLFDDPRICALTNDHAIRDRLRKAYEDEFRNRSRRAPRIPLEVLEKIWQDLYSSERLRVGRGDTSEYIKSQMEDLFHRDCIQFLLGAIGNHRTKVQPVSGSAGCGKSTFLRYYFSFYRPQFSSSKYICLRLDLSERSSTSTIIADSLQQIGMQVFEMFGEDNSRVDTMRTRELSSIISRLLEQWHQENAGVACEVFLWIDNVDTAVEEVQVACVKKLLDYFAKGRGISKFINIIVVSVRPETYDALGPQALNQYEGNNFELSSVNVPNVLEKRVLALEELLKGQEWTLTTEESLPWSPQICGLAVRKWGDGNGCRPQMVLPSTLESYEFDAETPDRYTVFRHWGRSDADQLFIDIKDYAKGVGLTGASGVLGVGSDEARRIYQSLCGRSVRRALQICERLINSKGVLVSLKRKTRLGAYTFLDAIVSSELEGATQGNLVNCYSLESVMGCNGHQFIVPYALFAIKSSDGSENKKIVPRDYCVSTMRSLGFGDAIISVLLLFLKTARLLRPIIGETGLYHRSEYTWEAHRMLCFEISYLDNVAQRSGWSLTPRIQTNGYEVGMIPRRYQTTLDFIGWLWRAERTWLKSVPAESRKALIDSGVPCTSIEAAISFCKRLRGLQKHDQLDSRIMKKISHLLRKCVEDFGPLGNYIDDCSDQPSSDVHTNFDVVFESIA